MEKWVQENLIQLLNIGDTDDLARYIINIETEELDTELKSLLDFNDSKHRQFVTELKRRRASSAGKKNNNTSEKVVQRPNEKKKGKYREKENSGTRQQQQQQQQQPVPQPVEKHEKNKSKFVNLYSEEGKDRQTILLKGRCKCECEARAHPLVNNCLNCGRIVCEQERAGPCFFCGAMVCTPDQQTVLSSNTKQSDTLYNKLRDQKLVQDPLEHRDKLLEYDRNSSRRTEVIDDECDYYQSSNSVWLSSAEREKLQKREREMRDKKHESRLTRKITFDFAGRELVEEPEENFYDALNAELPVESAASIIARLPDDANVCPSIDFARPWYVEMNVLNGRSNAKPKVDYRTSSHHNKIQDKEYLEMVDDGVCLSLHQPYASLLVAGIKTHEGRGWYSSHRGRLWIAAASTIPDTETISMLENRYRVLINENMKFPQSYPTGCLLGCVTVTDVLSNEEYRRRYPQGEVDSPFIFICQDCHELPLKFPMSGKHKIYKLEKKIHQAAVKCLEQSLKVPAA